MAGSGGLRNISKTFDFIDLFASEFIFIIEPIELAHAFYNCCIINRQCFDLCLYMSDQDTPRHKIIQTILSALTRPFSGRFWHVVLCILREHGNILLAERIERCIRKLGASNQITRLPTNNMTSSRGFYMAMRLVLDTGILVNPRAQFTKLAENREKFLPREPCHNRKLESIMADKYAATLLITLVIPPAMYELDVPDTYTERLTNVDKLKKIAPRTTNPLLTMLMLCNRLITLHAFAGNYEVCEVRSEEAMELASMVGVCPELANMYYCRVYYLLKNFERHPSSQIRNELETSVLAGLQVLRTSETDLDQFNMRQFLLMKLVFCLLGIGITCRVIQNCIVTQGCIAKARRYLAQMDDIMKHVTTRRKMMYYLAKSRIEGLCENTQMANKYIEKAYHYAIKGHFSEDVVIKEYMPGSSDITEPETVEFRQMSDNQRREPRAESVDIIELFGVHGIHEDGEIDTTDSSEKRRTEPVVNYSLDHFERLLDRQQCSESNEDVSVRSYQLFGDGQAPGTPEVMEQHTRYSNGGIRCGNGVQIEQLGLHQPCEPDTCLDSEELFGDGKYHV